MITNFDIEDASQEYKLPLVGVYSKNRIPPRMEMGGYVINLENDIDELGNLLDGSQ